jgi:signal transduction histidine kinase/DNA-binding NarL/FixJ family response regulator
VSAGPGDDSPPGRDGPAARAAGLIAVAEDLAGELSLRPLLERILVHATGLLHGDAGSVCSVDEAAGTYRKEADIGVACQSGQVFPLTEGMTGIVVARRAPTWFRRYDQVPGGHVAQSERATLRGVIGVPLEWRGRIIGACIVFSRDQRRVFGPDDAELLELFARHAAIALAHAQLHEAAEERARSQAAAAERDRLLADLHDTVAQRLASVQVHIDAARRELTPAAPAAAHLDQASAAASDALAQARLTLLGTGTSPLDGRTLDAALQSEATWAQSTGALDVRVVTAGTPVPVDGAVARELVRVAREALTNIVRHAGARTVRLGLLYEPATVSLLVQDDGQGFAAQAGWPDGRYGLRALAEQARELGGSVEVDSVPGWGTRIRARFPGSPAVPGTTRPALRILLAAGRPVQRAGLARLLTWAEPGIEVVAEAASIDQARSACAGLLPDVVVADLGLPPGDAPDIVTALLRGHPRLAVVGICEAGSDQEVAAAMRAGARGCVDAGADGPELARAVVAAGRGQAILSGAVLQQLHRGLRDDSGDDALTDRERQVRGLMELGLPDKAIAERLVLSVKTVEKHAGAVLRKTGARNRTELAAQASRGRSAASR